MWGMCVKIIPKKFCGPTEWMDKVYFPYSHALYPFTSLCNPYMC